MNRVLSRTNVSVTTKIFRRTCSTHPAFTSGSNEEESNVKINSIEDDSPQHDIAIVGGGMVGIAFAASLASKPLTKHLNVAIIDNNPLFGTKSTIEKGHPPPPDPRVSTVTPATISFLKGIGAWKYIEEQRHAYFDKMQVWDYTGLGYTRYYAKDADQDILGCVVENKVLQSSQLSCVQESDLQKTIYPASSYCSPLSRAIAQGIALGTDIGEANLLKRYEAERKPANIAMMAVLDGIQKMYAVNLGLAECTESGCISRCSLHFPS
ncbi:FAD/NAD(P)-binding oxidoreductase family protein [Raphanus sativus]|nr:FAD/NAD(P)-binding oxidoreductase family protein [Raphanus sativus]